MIRRYTISLLLVLMLQAILLSCSKKIYPATENNPVFFPAPPNTARIQFLTRYGSSADVNKKQSKFKSFIAGREEQLPIKKPYGITIEEGTILIVDPGIAGLELIDLKNESFEYFVPQGRGMLRFPLNCAVDKEGFIYVADAGRSQVVIFDKNLEYKGEIGGGEKFNPSDVSIGGDSIYVTDPKQNRINIYDRSTGNLLSSFPDPEKVRAGDREWLYNPLNLEISGDKIYVTDFGDSRIKIHSIHGKFLKSVGSYGRGLGQFVRPKGIAVDRDLNLYAVDAGFQNVQVFNSDGQLLMFFGGPYQGPGDMYLPANVMIDYDHLGYYEKYVHPEYELKYLIFVTNQYGPDKVSVYGRIELKQ